MNGVCGREVTWLHLKPAVNDYWVSRGQQHSDTSSTLTSSAVCQQEGAEVNFPQGERRHLSFKHFCLPPLAVRLIIQTLST